MSVDVETLSYVNLQTMGAEAYTRDLRTRCLMFVYHLVGDPSPGTLWLEGDPPPASFVEHTLGGGRLTGWNVIGFDRLVFRRILTRQHGFPEIPDDAWHDSMHMAAAANLPRSLDGCATAVGLGFEANLKDNNRIRRITNAAKTAMPAPVRTILTYPERFDPKLVEDLQWLAARCVQDVVLEEANMARLPGWPQVRPWLHMPAIDRGINDRGVLMDRALVEGMANAAEFEKTRLSREIAKLTNHQVPAVTNIEKLKTWLIGCGVQLPLKEEKKKPGHIDEGDAQILADDSEDESSEKESSYRLRKNDIADLLARTDVPEHCRLALAIRAEAAKSSVAKLNRMLTMAGPDDRLNGIFILGGGQQTLRFCLAEGTPVLVRDSNCITSEKPIEFVSLDDQVWDGDCWVPHDGVVFSGVKPVITHDGVTATKDHEVFISDTIKIQLTEAVARKLPLFGGKRRPSISGVLSSVATPENVFRADQNTSDSALVATCSRVEQTQSAPADSRCAMETRPRDVHNCDCCRQTDTRTSGNTGAGYDPRLSDHQSGPWIQPDGRWGGAAGSSHPLFLAGDQERSRPLCGLPEAPERGRQSRRSDATDSGSARRAETLERGKPQPDARPDDASSRGAQEMARGAPSERVPSAKLGCRAERFCTASRPTVHERSSTVGCAIEGRERGDRTSDIGSPFSISCDPDRHSQSSTCSTNQGRQTECRRDQTQGSTEGRSDGLLDAGAPSSQSRVYAAGARETSRLARTYDILNAGPRNRFLAAGRLVSNSSGGPQFHNLTRDVFGNPDEIALVNDIDDKNPANKQVIKRLGLVALNTAIEAGRTGDADLLRAMYEIPRKDAQGRVQIAGVMTWVSRMMRRTLAAPLGHALLNGDFAQVEARITAWLAQQTDVLETYRSGGDVYKLTAAGIYKIALELITKQMRQAGKVSILACGFGGGPHALLAMAYNYGMILSLAEATPIVKGWRESNAATVRYWYATDDAAANAVRYPGREFPVAPLGLVSYFMQDNCLCCRLPSERLLRYWAPRLHQDYWADGRPKERPSLTGIAIKGRAVFRRSLYHTILVENQVQGIGADLLGIGLENVDQQNIPIVLHVHDNIAAETPESRADRDLVIFREAMLDMPAWIGNLPMGVDADYGARFG